MWLVRSPSLSCCQCQLPCLQRLPQRLVHPALPAGGVAAGCVLAALGFAYAQRMLHFGPLFAGSEFGMFLMAAPVNAVLLWSVPPELRPFALSAAEFTQHLLGDIPSPPALGWLQVSVSVAGQLLLVAAVEAVARLAAALQA